MSTGIADILGNHPIAGKATYESQVRRVAREWLRLCPINRKTTYYFDSAAGDDDTGDGSEANPWQTVARMNLVAAADVALKLKRGSVWRTTTQIDIKGGSISAYGTGAPPLITGFTQTIASGGAAWTNAAGDRWTTTDITTLGWIKEQGSDWPKVYKQAASTAEVEANARSFFASGGTLHINAGSGIDPNDIAWEASPASGAEYQGIYSLAGGARVDGIVATGQNCRASLTSSYGITLGHTGDTVGCVTSCECYYHPRHNIGHVNGGSSGGRSLFMNCTFGYFNEDSGTSHVDYTLNGDHEGIVLDCVCPYGRLPENVTRDYANGRATFGHTGGGGATVGALHVVGLKMPVLNAFGCATAFHVNDKIAATTIDEVRYVLHRCDMPATPGRSQAIGRTSIAYVACDFRNEIVNGVIQGASEAFATVDDFRGFILGCNYEVDCSALTALTRVGMTNPTSSGDLYPNIANCRFHAVGNGTIDVHIFNRDTYNFGDGGDDPVYNTIWSAEGLGTGYCETGLRDNATPRNNAMYGMSQSVTAPPGYGLWTDTYEPNYLPPREPTPDMFSRGYTSAPVLCEVDLLGRPLAAPGEAIGPYGRPADTFTADDVAIERGNLIDRLGELYEVENNPTAIKAFQDLYPHATFVEGDGQRAYARLGGELDLI